MKIGHCIKGHKILITALNLFFLLMAGCSIKVHKSLESTDPRLANPIIIDSIIPQDEISIRTKESNWSAGSGGLLWVMIDKSANKSRGKKAEECVAPLLEATADVNFREMYWSALEQAVNESTWLKAKEFEKRVANYEEEEIKNFQTPLLMINTVFELSIDSQILKVQTWVNLYLDNLEKPDYHGAYTYYSDRIGSVDVKDKDAVALWAANNASVYRTCLAEGIQENISMMRYDLLSNPANPASETGNAISFKFNDQFLDLKYKIEGITLKEDENRKLIREAGGNLFSFPVGLAQ